MSLGMPLPVYEARVGPTARTFHEYAELVKLHAEGILPLTNDDEKTDLKPSDKLGKDRPKIRN